MTTTHTPAPRALPAADQATPFRDRVRIALETHQGDDLVAHLGALHDRELAELTGQASAARDAAAQTAAQAAVDQHLLTSLLGIVRPVLRTSGENAARAAHQATMVEAARTLVREAEAAGAVFVDAGALRNVLDTPDVPPPFRPRSLGFVPSDHYRIGHFRHTVTSARWHLPFAGYMACEETPDRPMTVHVAFLHEGTVRPRPELYAEYGMVMDRME